MAQNLAKWAAHACNCKRHPSSFLSLVKVYWTLWACSTVIVKVGAVVVAAVVGGVKKSSSSSSSSHVVTGSYVYSPLK